MKNKERIRVAILFGALTLGVPYAFSAPVNEQKAKEIAIHARNSDNGMRKAASINETSIAMTEKFGDQTCFYVVNYGSDNGFAIVSGDDRLPEVLGYADEGSFDASNIPCNLQWWLDSYKDQITVWYKNPSMQKEPVNRKALRAAMKPIAPICKTKWNQDAPYNNTCPMIDGYRSVTGCVATAMAQVMKAYEWPDSPVGSSAGVVFDGTTYDWSNMLDEYITGKYNSNEAAAVAKLMRDCGASVNMTYSPMESGAYTSDVQYALFTYFGYSESAKLEFRDYYSFTQWNEMVYAELAKGHPVLYSGYANAGGHAFVCDGYRGGDFFHLNWGWGGAYDGYFLLNALNPGTGGIGSHEGGYNSGQLIITDVEKANGPAKRQMNMVADGGFYYAGSEFNIKGGNNALIYNPHKYPVTCAVGVKVVNVDDPEKVYYFASNQGQKTYNQYYGLPSFSANVNGLPDGNYRVTPVSNTDNEWYDIPVFYNDQTYVSLKVVNGTNQYSNPPASERQAKIIVNSIDYADGMKGGGNFVINVYLSNVGTGDYFGKITTYFSLADNEYFVDQFENFVSLPAGRTSIMEVSGSTSFDEEFVIKFRDKDGIFIGEPLPIYLEPGEDYTNSTTLGGGSISPNFSNIGELYSVSTVVRNNGYYPSEEAFELALYKMDTNTDSVNTLSTNPISLAPYQAITIASSEKTWDIPAGSYYWMMTTSEDEYLSGPWPLKLVSGPENQNGVDYYFENDKKGYVAKPEGEQYVGDIKIAPKVSGRTISRIQGGTFTFANELTSVMLPYGIRELNPGEFYCADKLALLGISSEQPPVIAPDILPADRFADVVLNVPNGQANLYKRMPIWEQFSMPTWELSCEEGIAIEGGFLTNENGEIYSPYYVSPREHLTLTVSHPEGTTLYLIYTLDGKEYAEWFGEGNEAKLPAIPSGNAIGRFTTITPAGIAGTQTAASNADVFDIAGSVVLRNASESQLNELAPGIYIYRGRKLIVKK